MEQHRKSSAPFTHRTRSIQLNKPQSLGPSYLHTPPVATTAATATTSANARVVVCHKHPCMQNGTALRAKTMLPTMSPILTNQESRVGANDTVIITFVLDGGATHLLTGTCYSDLLHGAMPSNMTVTERTRALSSQPAPPALRARAAGPCQPDQRRGSGQFGGVHFNGPLGCECEFSQQRKICNLISNMPQDRSNHIVLKRCGLYVSMRLHQLFFQFSPVLDSVPIWALHARCAGCLRGTENS